MEGAVERWRRVPQTFQLWTQAFHFWDDKIHKEKVETWLFIERLGSVGAATLQSIQRGGDGRPTEEKEREVVRMGVEGYHGRMIQRVRRQRLSPDLARGQAPGMGV